MTYDKLKISVEDNVAWISINNPPVNALSSNILLQIQAAVIEQQQNEIVRVIIISGEGSNFAAGADIKEIENVFDPKEGEQMCLKAHSVVNTITDGKIPVIAAVNGYCLGGGNELAMACHIRIATDKARFGQPEINIGIVPGLGGSQTFTRIVGKSNALEFLLTGDLMSSQKAKEIGLVNFVVPEADLKKQVMGLAKKIASKSKVTVSKILEAVRLGLDMKWADSLKMEAKCFGEIMATEDKKEGIKAFFEKRAPRFSDK